MYDISLSGLNKLTKAAARKECMRFGKALHWLLYFILAADSALGLIYLYKVYLADAYMHILVRTEYAPFVTFIILK